MDLAGVHEQLAHPISINYRHKDEYGWIGGGMTAEGRREEAEMTGKRRRYEKVFRWCKTPSGRHVVLLISSMNS